MKLNFKNKAAAGSESLDANVTDNGTAVSQAGSKKRFWLTRPAWLILIVIVVLIAAGLIYYFGFYGQSITTPAEASHETDMINEALQKGDKAQALADARKVLAYEPNDQNAIGLVASLTPNHAESQQLYARLLTIYKKSPDASHPTPVTYWAEGNLAAKAGNTDQAKQDYQKSIAAAKSSSSSYYQGVANRSQAALKELQ